ncbi:energy-coupling factor ABC transporter substrate-binding protein [Synechococcus sp. PCC 6716]|nr:energy-coupling factor ABC transporter substrate-binding protein [Synechococcus sp. PCC 6716]
MSRKNQRWNNWVLVVAVVVLAIAPLLLARKAEFSGADAEAEAVIQEVSPSYQPWFNPVFEPTSGEIESLFFAVQAALGAGVIGYVFGLYRSRHERQASQHHPEVSQSPEFKDH